MGIEYCSPLPGAKLVLPATSIIVRVHQTFKESDVSWQTMFTVSGTKSGIHSGEARLSDDKMSVVFLPDVPFTLGEEVSVTYRIPVTIRARNEQAIHTFSFTITPSRPAKPFSSLKYEEESVLTSSMNLSKPSGRMFSPQGDTLPIDFPYISTQITGTPSPGYLFLGSFNFPQTAIPYLLILNNDGTPVFYKRMQEWCLDFKIQPNGLLTYYDGVGEKYYAMDNTFTIVDSFACGNGYTTDLHELKLLPNGHSLMMSYDPQPVDMSVVVSGGDSAAIVTGLVIQELDSMKNVIFQWRSWDHFAITDAVHENLTRATIDYVHGNAIDIDTDGNILISSRHLSEITKINRSTGDIIWRWGGVQNEFTFINDSLGFFYQHDIRKLANGHYSLYDNGNFHSPKFSRPLEYELDEVNKTARLVWEYRHSPNRYGGAMGNMQRLPSGNTLIGWGSTNPTVTEVDSTGAKVFELTFDTGIFTYRAFRFEWEPTNQSDTITIPVATSLSPNYPNPFNPGTKLTLNLARTSVVHLAVYDLLGNTVMTLVDSQLRTAGVYNVSIDLSHFASGIYFCRLFTPYQTETRKLLYMR